MIKHSGEEWRHLLGFREGCLFACAEVSLWTKFCEIDIVQVVDNVLRTLPNSNEIKIPEHLARFEEHFKQPVRMHNVDKLLKHFNQGAQHDFAEGPTMSLADLIVVPCFHVVSLALPNLPFGELLPSVLKWYKLVTSDPLVAEALCCISIPTLNILMCASYSLPKVPNHSLYKSDPKRYKPKLKLYTRQEDVDEALRYLLLALF